MVWPGLVAGGVEDGVVRETAERLERPSTHWGQGPCSSRMREISAAVRWL